MEDFGCPSSEPPFAGLAKERKMTHAELIRAIRFMVVAEYEAIQLYMQPAESIETSLPSKFKRISYTNIYF